MYILYLYLYIIFINFVYICVYKIIIQVFPHCVRVLNTNVECY